MNELYCNNCRKVGHLYSHCKMPITSFGIIVFRIHPIRGVEYLMIRRKDTLGYIDFMRGKYIVQNKQYIMNMLKQMTVHEKNGLLKGNFSDLWKNLWGENANYLKYKKEELISKEKYEMLYKGIFYKSNSDHLVEKYSIETLVRESYQYGVWKEPEWGFPKGRPKYQEKDFNCALREFCEETGYWRNILKHIYNIHPFEEIFTGSNYKSYRHKYFLMHMDYDESLINVCYEKIEVSKMEWKVFDECIFSIRSYNLEKKRLITNIHNFLSTHKLFYNTG